MKISVWTTSFKYIILGVSCLASLTVYAVDLGNEGISKKNAGNLKNNLKNTQTNINTGRDIATQGLQKKINDRGVRTTNATKTTRDMNKASDCVRILRGGDCTKNKAITSPALQPSSILPKRPQPQVLPRINTAPRFNALPKINIPSKLKMPTVKLNNNQNKFQPSNKGGFSPAPQKPRLGIGIGKNKTMPALKAPALGAQGLAPAAAPKQGGFVPAGTPKQGGFAPAGTPGQGGFTPPGVSSSVNIGNKLSTQQLQTIAMRSNQIEMLRKVLANAKRAAEQRIARLGREQITSGADCDDTDPTINPGSAERCDGKDNNCNGEVDEGVELLRYADVDGDGHGDPDKPIYVCTDDDSRGLIARHGNDCDDNDPRHWNDCASAPSATE